MCRVRKWPHAGMRWLGATRRGGGCLQFRHVPETIRMLYFVRQTNKSSLRRQRETVITSPLNLEHKINLRIKAVASQYDTIFINKTKLFCTTCFDLERSNQQANSCKIRSQRNVRKHCSSYKMLFRTFLFIMCFAAFPLNTQRLIAAFILTSWTGFTNTLYTYFVRVKVDIPILTQKIPYSAIYRCHLVILFTTTTNSEF
jgi:hypothetical protein